MMEYQYPQAELLEEEIEAKVEGNFVALEA